MDAVAPQLTFPNTEWTGELWKALMGLGEHSTNVQIISSSLCMDCTLTPPNSICYILKLLRGRDYRSVEPMTWIALYSHALLCGKILNRVNPDSLSYSKEFHNSDLIRFRVFLWVLNGNVSNSILYPQEVCYQRIYVLFLLFRKSTKPRTKSFAFAISCSQEIGSGLRHSAARKVIQETYLLISNQWFSIFEILCSIISGMGRFSARYKHRRDVNVGLFCGSTPTATWLSQSCLLHLGLRTSATK